MALKFDGKGRPRLIGAAARKLRKGKREGVEFVLQELAVATADLVDATRDAGDGKTFLASSKELQALLEKLGGRGERGGAGGAGAVEPAEDGGTGFLADIMGAGPEVRDAEDA